MQLPDGMRDDLSEHGVAVLRSVSPDSVVALTTTLGVVICVSQVRLNPAVGSYLASPEPIPPHTDHPDARYIAWMCHENDPGFGDNLLVDGHEAIDALPASLRGSLSAGRLDCPQLDRTSLPTGSGRPSMRPHPVWDEEGRALFFAPWLPRSEEDAEPLAQFARILDAAPRNRVRLEPGDVLVVDNHRILHGREALPRESRRCLMRYWIQAAA